MQSDLTPLGRRCKILAVDDRPERLLTLKAMLKDVEVELLRAYSVDEALSLLRRHDFALAVLDAQMAGADAFEAAALLRSREPSGRLPILFLMAPGEDEERIHRGFQLDGVDFLLKPIHPLLLRAKIEALLQLDRFRRKTQAARQEALEAHQTAQRRQDAVRQSEEKYRALWDLSGDAVMLLDESGFLDGNDSALRMFRCPSHEQLRGRHPADFSPPAQPDGTASRVAAQSRIAAALRDGSSHFEWRHRRLDGTEFPADVLLKAIVLDGKTLLQAVVRDVTDRKRIEQELKDYTIALKSANEALGQFSDAAEAASHAKSEFLANMSHEIRTPMTAVLGFADVLLGTLEDEESLDAARAIKRNGQHLLELLNDILDVSKIEAGKVEIEQIACSPARVVAEVLSLMRVRAEGKGLPLEVEYASAIPEAIRSDPVRLRQILINLLGNAIKFTETGSEAIRKVMLP